MRTAFTGHLHDRARAQGQGMATGSPCGLWWGWWGVREGGPQAGPPVPTAPASDCTRDPAATHSGDAELPGHSLAAVFGPEDKVEGLAAPAVGQGGVGGSVVFPELLSLTLLGSAYSPGSSPCSSPGVTVGEEYDQCSCTGLPSPRCLHPTS